MRVVFIGTGEIGLPTLRWLVETAQHELVGVVTQPDKPVGRDQRIQAPPIKAAIADSGIPILQPRRIKHEEAVEQIRALQPQVIVVMAYGQILPLALLEIPSIACLNLHASLLPKHRGAAPIQAAIVTGDSETGLTVMYMDEGLDTGDVLLQSRIAVASDETGGSLHDRLAELGPRALEEALRELAAGTARRIHQNAAQATYAPKLEREHGMIDWTEPAESIERKIRAFDPWPGAYLLVKDTAERTRKIKVFSATVSEEIRLAPGEMIATNAGGRIVVGASGGCLRVEQVQLEGKKRMGASELLRGHPWLESASVVPVPAVAP